jgi:hypothetical protein
MPIWLGVLSAIPQYPYLMMASGELLTVRKGRAVRVPARALEQWVEQRTSAVVA